MLSISQLLMFSTVFLLFISSETGKVTHTIMDSYSSSVRASNQCFLTYVCTVPPIVWRLNCCNICKIGLSLCSVHCLTLWPVVFVTLFNCFPLLCLLLKSCVSWTQIYRTQQQLALSLYWCKSVLSLFLSFCLSTAGKRKQALFLFPVSKFSCFF